MADRTAQIAEAGHRRPLVAVLRRWRRARIRRHEDRALAAAIAQRDELMAELRRAVETGEKWKALAQELLPDNIRTITSMRPAS